MSEFSKSLEKTVEYLRERYPSDHPLLTNLETNLDDLKAKNKKSSSDTPLTGCPTEKAT